MKYLLGGNFTKIFDEKYNGMDEVFIRRQFY